MTRRLARRIGGGSRGHRGRGQNKGEKEWAGSGCCLGNQGAGPEWWLGSRKPGQITRECGPDPRSWRDRRGLKVLLGEARVVSGAQGRGPLVPSQFEAESFPWIAIASLGSFVLAQPVEYSLGRSSPVQEATPVCTEPVPRMFLGLV